MRADLGGLIAAALVAACGAKTVDLGPDAENAKSGASGSANGTGDGSASDSATGGTSSNSATGGASSNSATGGASSNSATGGAATLAGGGNTDAGSDTVPQACGDGHLGAGEACDDGNSRSGDGCSANCTVEPGWACVTGSCGWICGDQLVAGPAQCVVGECQAAGAVTAPAPPAAGSALAPCDIYAEDGGPCVAAHSMVRALYATYAGPLYRVKNGNGDVLDIPPLAPGGFANSAAQDAFCAGSTCTISIIYDQSGQGNHLRKAPAGAAKTTPDNEANATAVSATFGGHVVYGLHVVPGVAYRNNNACGTATGDDPETEYAIVAGDVYNQGCCFDYGNVERDSRDDGEGAAEAVYFGTTTIWGKGAGAGPWVMADLENGLWAGNVSPYDLNEPLSFKFVTAMLKGDAAGKNHWAIKNGNAQAGTLTKVFDGPRPSARYNPMKKQGGIGLGAAGDNSNGAIGNFFEGVMTAHYSSDGADAAVQANVVSVYGAD